MAASFAAGVRCMYRSVVVRFAWPASSCTGMFGRVGAPAVR
jgi:hypothetical protein